MATIEAVEKKEAGLKAMMKTVGRDKRKIEETIATLDEYKKEALEKTWREVGRDFGAIFADLLPGSFAKLVPLEGRGVGEGLEVKVSLGKVWKSSLAELSGGQRYGFGCLFSFFSSFPPGGREPGRSRSLFSLSSALPFLVVPFLSVPRLIVLLEQIPHRPLPHPRPPTILPRPHVHP